MENTKEQIKKYLSGLSPEKFAIVSGYMTRDAYGIPHPPPPGGGGCNTSNCHDHVGCNSEGFSNYYCACSGGDCITIPIVKKQ